MLPPTCCDGVSLVITFQVVCEGVKEYQMKFKFLKTTLASIFLAGSSLMNVANAALITYEFSGAFSRSVVVEPLANADANVGDYFLGQFTYDDEEPLFGIINPDTRAIYSTGEILASTGINSYKASSSPQLQIFNNWEFTPGGIAIDDFFLSVYQYDNFGDGFYLLQLNLRDYTTATLDSLSIPNKDQIEALASGAFFFLRRFDSTRQEVWWADGAISNINLASVTEPTTLAIFALGLMGLASRRFKEQS
ncbi:MAG: hypothetical protein ACJAS1_006475 [Oleiphilaceae bacterium]